MSEDFGPYSLLEHILGLSKTQENGTLTPWGNMDHLIMTKFDNHPSISCLLFSLICVKIIASINLE